MQDSTGCGIAPGTLYNYYADKDALLLATVESVWQSVFHADGACGEANGFPERVEGLFRLAKEGAARYPMDFVLDNLLMLLVQGAEDCGVLCALLRRVLYRQ